jgi:aminoglycoside phosphotransferase (APT) family kinase protein
MADASDLAGRLESLVGSRTGGAAKVSDLARLPGGASRETWSFKADDRKLILRRDPPGSAATSAREAEFELLKRAQAKGVAVPRALWLFGADELGSPGFVMEHVEGETIARRILRDDEYAQARPRLAAQCGRVLAQIHTVDVTGLDGFTAPAGNACVAELHRYRAAMDAFGEPHPTYELAIRWLERSAPEPERTTLVHGDFRLGNLIVGPEGLKAVLDWELAHLGDPWEDLGWLCVRSWRFGGPGEVGGFGSRDDLYEAYEKESGIEVHAGAVRWWEVFGNFKWGISCLAQTFTHLSGRVRSVELAAIGRRTAETEYDLLNLIG